MARYFGASVLAPLLFLVGCAAPPVPTPVAAVPAASLANLRFQAVLVAGDASLPVWDRAVDRVAAGLVAADAASPASIQRFSAQPERQARGAGAAIRDDVLGAIAALRPAPDEGCFILLTMHGSPDRGLRFMPEQRYLTPAALDAALQQGCGGAPTFVVASGCFSGGFARGGMARPNRVVLTAARADRASFGCAPRFEVTVFDGCLIAGLNAGAPTARALGGRVAACVADAEARLRVAPASEPQVHVGASVPALVPRFAASRGERIADRNGSRLDASDRPRLGAREGA